MNILNGFTSKIDGNIPTYSFIKKMSVAKLQITLHRPNASASHDDVITVTPFMDEFKLEFVGKQDKLKHFVYLSDEQVVQYVEDMFHLLPTDADAYQFMQFDLPCFPSVMYKVNDLDDKVVRRSIRDRLWAVLSNWPERVRYGSAPVGDE